MQQQQQQQQQSMSSGGMASLPPELQAQMVEIERLATLAYQGNQNALATLAPFQTNAECVAQARLLLDHSTNMYALHLAARSLTSLLTSFFHTFTGAQTLEIRNYLLNYIANACTSQVVADMVVKKLVGTTARVAKLGWRQDPNAPAGQLGGGVSAPGGAAQVAAGGHASIVETCGIFFRLESIRHHRVGVLLLGQLISEMEAACSVESPSDHRKTSRHFRDHALLEILNVSLTEIRAAANFARLGAKPEDVERLLEESLHLFASCLSFDFIGSVPDDTTTEDSSVTLQVPASWRTLVEDTTATSPIAILGDVFETFPNSESVQAEVLNAFSCLASMRKSLFTNEDSRLGFMSTLMQRHGAMIEKFGTKSQQGYTAAADPCLVSSSRLFHEFARFLGRFKYNYTLNDCVRSPNFEAWLQTLFTFTVQQSTTDYEGEAANSLSYFLGVWSRIATDVSALKMPDGSSTYQVTNSTLLNPGLTQPITHTHKIQQAILEVIPKICETFIDARLKMVMEVLTKDGGVQDEDAEDTWRSLFAEPDLSDQLKYLSVLCRFHYVQVKAFLKARLEPLAEQYKITLQAMLNGTAVNGAMANGLPHTPANTALQLQVLETQLTMLVYILGSTIGCERSLLLLPGSSQHFQQLFSGIEKMTTNDQLQILDAELVSWVFQLLPVFNVRVEKSSENASAALRRQQKTEPTSLNASRAHMATAVIYFFDQFRRKFMNSLAHLNFDSYVHTRGPSLYSIHSLAPTPNGATDDGMAMASPISSTQSMIPTPEMIAHGNQANIFSRTAFFLRQPMTPNHLMQMYVNQIFLFLNYISFDFDVVTATLELFDALSLNYATSDHIAKLEAVRQFLQGGQVGLGSAVTSNNGGMNSTQIKGMMPSGSGSGSTLLMADMAFLHSTTHPRLQTTFFQILTRLVTKSCNVDLFPSFLASFSEQFKQLEAVQNLTALPPNVLDQVILLIHKVHGVVLSIASAVVYKTFFEWYMVDNSYLSLITRLVESFWSNPKVIYPVLNFHGEFITNRSQRIRFDANSAYGVELFKASYRIISTYASRMMMTPAAQDSGISENDLYDTRLKGISKVLMLVANSLNGQYANFGVMHYYKDPVLKQCLQQTLQYAMSVRFAHIINFPRVAANYFAFLEVVFRQHIELMVDICDTPKFLAVVSSLHEGLLSLHQTQVIEAAKALDALMSWHWEHQQPKYANHPARIALERHLAQSQTLLPEILCTLFNISVFDGHEQSLWALGRPLFGLLLCSPSSLDFYKQRLLAGQTLPASSQQELAQKIQQASEALMDGVEKNMDHGNRDRFQTNLTKFKENISAFCTRPE